MAKCSWGLHVDWGSLCPCLPWSSSLQAQIVHILQTPAFMSNLFMSVLHTNTEQTAHAQQIILLCTSAFLAASLLCKYFEHLFGLGVICVPHPDLYWNHCPGVHFQPLQSPNINPLTARAENMSLCCPPVSANQIPKNVKYLQWLTPNYTEKWHTFSYNANG